MPINLSYFLRGKFIGVLFLAFTDLSPDFGHCIETKERVRGKQKAPNSNLITQIEIMRYI